MKKITHAMLVKYEACKEHLALFDKLYPKGIPITVEDFTIAEASGLNVMWASCFLSPAAPKQRANGWHDLQSQDERAFDKWWGSFDAGPHEIFGNSGCPACAVEKGAYIAQLVAALQQHKYEP